MSLQWELECEVSRRPRQVVYIRMEADISALTYPNKWQAVCCPASASAGEGGDGGGGGGGGGLREEIKEEGREMGGGSTQEEGGVTL